MTKRFDESLHDCSRLLRRVADTFLRVPVESIDRPDVGWVLPFFNALRVEPFVLAVFLFRFFVKRDALIPF